MLSTVVTRSERPSNGAYAVVVLTEVKQMRDFYRTLGHMPCSRMKYPACCRGVLLSSFSSVIIDLHITFKHLDLVHMDLQGPYCMALFSKSKYLLLLINEFLGYYWDF